MTWEQTHARWRAIREVEAAIEDSADDSADGDLPWHDDYAEIFGDREGLLRALEYRWSLTVQAQLDPELPEPVLEETWQRITARHAGLLRVLGRCAHPDETARPETNVYPRSHA